MILPTRLQAGSWQKRLAEAGGAVGVRVGTFDDVYEDILNRAGVVVTYLSEPVQRRLLRAIIAKLNLEYYRSIQDKPGFVDVLMEAIREFKAGGIKPGAYLEAVEQRGEEKRLAEIGEIYSRYQQRLQQEGWSDYLGAGWLALEALKDGLSLPEIWSPVIIDGFDDFSPVQIDVIAELAARFPDLMITLTGELDDSKRPFVHKRFLHTKKELEKILDLDVIHPPDSQTTSPVDKAIRHLERSLFSDEEDVFQGANEVSLLAAPDREGEVRSALRWLKKSILEHGWEPSDVGILFRNFEPYRPYLYPVAKEFGLPLHVEEGQPLRENPAISALLNLLKIADPQGDHLAWRETIEAWRSPYFQWEGAYPEAGAEDPIGIRAVNAETLSWVARWGSVIQGHEQWHEVFEMLAASSMEGGTRDEEFSDPPEELPRAEKARILWDKFSKFEKRIHPPQEKQSYRTFIRWVEGLIGAEEGSDLGIDLKMVQAVRETEEVLRVRDLEALRQFKDVMRGLLWAEKTVPTPAVTYQRFLEELIQAVEGTRYQPSTWEKECGILAVDVLDARGIPFKAVAILGLGEGEFPQTLQEDPFLRDEDRRWLRENFGLPLPMSTMSWEGEYFYEGLTRASHALFLTRARIADNGAPWQPSPFWEEVQRRVDCEPRVLTSQSRPTLEEASSWHEFLDSLCASSNADLLWKDLQHLNPSMAQPLGKAHQVLQERDRDRVQGAGTFDGQLFEARDIYSQLFDRDHIWSASRLESYQTCPYFFFTAHVLGLEPRDPPREGLDARQLGNIYHHILEKLYRKADNPTLESLLETLPEVAGEVLDAAPRQEGFRETAWWQQTREEITTNLRRSLEVLERLDQDFTFFKAEKTFGIKDRQGPALIVKGESGDQFKLRGFIDRIDKDPRGNLRVIDYKTSSPYGFTNRAVQKGKKLQLPLYALAAEQALHLGEVAEGFYFHVQHAEASRFQMSRYFEKGERGPRAAMERSVEEAWKAVLRARKGKFVPQVPDRNCPDYCPAAAYCWQYTPRNY